MLTALDHRAAALTITHTSATPPLLDVRLNHAVAINSLRYARRTVAINAAIGCADPGAAGSGTFLEWYGGLDCPHVHSHAADDLVANQLALTRRLQHEHPYRFRIDRLLGANPLAVICLDMHVALEMQRLIFDRFAVNQSVLLSAIGQISAWQRLLDHRHTGRVGGGYGNALMADAL